MTHVAVTRAEMVLNGIDAEMIKFCHYPSFCRNYIVVAIETHRGSLIQRWFLAFLHPKEVLKGDCCSC